MTGEGIDMHVYFGIPAPFGLQLPQQRPEALPLTVADPEDACSPLASRHYAGEETDRWLVDLHAREHLNPFLCLPQLLSGRQLRAGKGVVVRRRAPCACRASLATRCLKS